MAQKIIEVDKNASILSKIADTAEVLENVHANGKEDVDQENRLMLGGRLLSKRESKSYEALKDTEGFAMFQALMQREKELRQSRDIGRSSEPKLADVEAPASTLPS